MDTATGSIGGVLLVAAGLLLAHPFEILANCSPWSFGCFSFIVGGYIIHSSILEYVFYKQQTLTRTNWKIQPDKGQNIVSAYGPPILGRNKPNRHRLHRLFASINIFQAGSFAFTTCELSVRGTNKMYFDFGADAGAGVIVAMVMVQLLRAILLQSVLKPSVNQS